MTAQVAREKLWLNKATSFINDISIANLCSPNPQKIILSLCFRYLEFTHVYKVLSISFFASINNY